MMRHSPGDLGYSEKPVDSTEFLRYRTGCVATEWFAVRRVTLLRGELIDLTG